jgi:hypothetical protein
MFSDRLTELWRGKEWAEPSAAWMTLFNDKGAPAANRTAKVENAVLITPPPTSRLQEPPAASAQEPPRRLIPESTAASPVGSAPATTSTLGVAPAGMRDLPWLPEAEKRAESLEVKPTPPPPAPRISVAVPDVAPIPPAAPPPPPTPPVAAVSAPPVAAVSAPPPPVAAVNAPSAAEVAELLRRSRGHIDIGDIAGARLLLERAASGNEPSALMALAETYDPTILAKWGARGLRADPAKARALYQKAAERGIAEAKARVLALR